MKQIGLGMLQYAQDNDERITPWIESPASGTGVDAPDIWHTLIQPYVRSYQIFRCPGMKRPSNYGPHGKDGGSWPSYGLPGRPDDTWHSVYDYIGLRLNVVQEPDRTYLAVETVGDRNETNSAHMGNGRYYITWHGEWPNANGPNPAGAYFASDRHLETSNVLFFDGHVKAVKQRQHKDYIWFLRISRPRITVPPPCGAHPH